MTKVFVKYFFSVCVLLSFASAYAGSGYSASTASVEEVEQTASAERDDFQPSAKKLGTPGDKNLILDATELKEEKEDDDESVTVNRQGKTNKYSTIAFCALTRSYLFSYTTRILTFRKYFSFTASLGRHLIIQVFLI